MPNFLIGTASKYCGKHVDILIAYYFVVKSLLIDMQEAEKFVLKIVPKASTKLSSSDLSNQLIMPATKAVS